jgi:hypothetical protein
VKGRLSGGRKQKEGIQTAKFQKNTNLLQCEA